MGVTIFRPGQRLVIPGVQVYQPRPSAASGGWWDVPGQTCIAAYAPKGAASLAASYVNLTGNATYDAAPGVAPTWDATGGWTFNGTTQHLTTGVVPATGYSLFVRFSDRVSNAQYLCGCAKTAPTTRFGIYISTTAIQYDMDDDRTKTVTGPTSGVLGIAGNDAYRNGTIETLDVGSAGTGYPDIAIYVGARNLNGSAAALMSCKIQAFAVYSTTLSAGDVASLTTAMNAL